MKEDKDDGDSTEWRTRMATYRPPPPMPQERIWKAVRSGTPRARLFGNNHMFARAIAAGIALFAAGSALGYLAGRNAGSEDDAAHAAVSVAQRSADARSINWF